MKNTVFSGYIWDKYSHVSPQNDAGMTGMVDPLPVTSAGMLKINSNASNEVIGKFEPIKQYYLWTKLEHNATKGIVTCKRKPSEITLDDIIGFYLVDCDGSIGQEYIGIENIRDKEREGWVSNISSSINYDTLELVWEEDGTSGVDTFGFVGELTDIDIDDGSSNNLEDYCFNFSNSGTITITLTNLGNYALRDGTLYPINLYGGTGKTFGFDLYKYGSNVSMSRLRVNTISATQISGEQTSATVTFDVSSAGLYYVKCTIGTNIGTSSGYNFSMGTSDLVNYYPCDIICDWTLHVEATETMPDNMCVSVSNYLNYWYEKSGNDERFNPKYIDVNYFGQKFGWGNEIDKQQRVLWNNNNGSVPIEYVENFYPVKCASYCNVHTADVNDYDVPRLICVSDIPDFEIFKFGFNGTITYPNKPSVAPLISGTNMGKGTTKIIIGLTSIYWSDVFEPKEVCNAVDIHDIYYGAGGGLTVMNVNLIFEVLTRFPWVYDRPYDTNSLSMGDVIPVTFSDGSSKSFMTQRTSIHKVIGYQPTFTLNLNDQWRQSTLFMSGKTIYESFSNYNVNSGTATMTINIYGYKKFSLYIRSNAESNYDYVMVSQLDQSITGSTTYSNTTLVKAHTRGNQQTGNNLSNYTLVTYDNIDGGSHTITIVYRKDGSQHSGTDRGYVIIGDDTDEPYVEYLSTIHATCALSTGELLERGSITSIDYSNLKFKSITSGGTMQQYEHYLNFMEYTLMTGIEGNLPTGVALSGISLSSYDDEYDIYEYVGSFITLDGLGECLTNVKFRILETFGGNGNPVIAIKTSDLTSVFGKDCYFRFPIRVKSTSGIIELCLRVSVTDTEFIIHNEQIGNCTIWLGLNYLNGVHGVHLVDRSNDTPLYLCPVKGSYLPQYFIGDGSITNTFAHGHLYDDEDHLSIRTIYYQGEFMFNVTLPDGQLFSFIPPNCTTISDLGAYVHNSTPYIEIGTGFM